METETIMNDINYRTIEKKARQVVNELFAAITARDFIEDSSAPEYIEAENHIRMLSVRHHKLVMQLIEQDKADYYEPESELNHE